LDIGNFSLLFGGTFNLRENCLFVYIKLGLVAYAINPKNYTAFKLCIQKVRYSLIIKAPKPIKGELS
ncbi:hypothetical protein KG091_09065, partial [Carnobacteriaceae bacterium zg-ZUI78]|nr:hypothetical protein [Carnobacteriaceae bacterium zg-ZUI78]